MTTLPAKVYTRIGRTPRQLRLTNQIIMDSKNEEAYTFQIQKLQQERQRIRQCISDNLIALEESERSQTLKQKPKVIGVNIQKLTSAQTQKSQIQYLRTKGFTEKDIDQVLLMMMESKKEV